MSDLLGVMLAAGLVVKQLNTDGSIQRCGTLKKPNGKNGWYVVFENGRAAAFGNWESGDGYDYWSDGTLTEVDHKKVKAQIAELDKKRDAEQLQKAEDALTFYESCKEEGFSDYLKKKRLYPHGARFENGHAIVIPVQDATGKVWSYQKIYGDGSKYFMPGGKIKGGFFKIGFDRNVSKDELIVVCEGFATGASIHQATKLPVIVAFNAGNLKPVCDSIEFRNLIIAADNDVSGVGEKAAQDSGYKYVMPEIQGWDFSDVFLEGKDVKRYFVKEQETNNSAIVVSGLVGEIADWITATAVRKQPTLSLAAALAFVGMLKGHRIKGRTNLRTNILCLSLAPTAAGKEHPQYAIDRLAEACGLGRHMMGRPTSGTGLLTGLDKTGCVGLLSVDEMGRYIGNITAKGAGGHQREIADYMVELFSSAGRTFRGRQYAKEKENPQIILQQPHFCCLGSTVPERLQAACTSSEIIDGFLNRWMVFSTVGRPQKVRVEVDKEPPQALVDKITGWLEQFQIKFDNYGNPQPEIVNFTPEAWDLFCEFDDKMEKAIDTATYPMDKLYARSSEHVEKISLILADDNIIGTGEVKTAITIVSESNNAIINFSGMIVDNKSEQDFMRVREYIKQEGEVKRSKLTYRCQFVDGGARRISEIIQVLLDTNTISERKVDNKILYKWVG